MSSRPEPGHVPVLDGVRGLAIVLVLLFHCAIVEPTTTANSVYLAFSSLGFTGVDLFFVLSGFLITGILLDLKRSGGALSSFYARRGLRTLPLYYAVLVISLYVLPGLIPADKAARFGSIAGDVPCYWLHLSNVAIARAAAFRHAVLDVSWSLAVEEQFYLIWPLAVLSTPSRLMLRMTLATVVMAFAIRVALVLSGVGPFPIYVLAPTRMDALAVGAFLAVIARTPPGLAPHRRAAKIALAVALPVSLLTISIDYLPTGAVVVPGSVWPLATIGFSAIAVTFGALLVLAVTAPKESALSRFFASPVLVTCGKYSYGVYLVHLPVRAAIRDRIFGPSWAAPRVHFTALLGSEVLGQLLFNVIAGAAALGVAWVSYHVFEARFLALKSRFPTSPTKVG